ncbi:MAG: DNA-3-methyladenine glycosylase 2 family protein [Acidimicrobiia bacterium]
MPRVRRELLDAAAAVGDADPAMRAVIDDIGPPDLRRGRPRANHFAELARAVCFQQLAGAAARTIHGRFVALFGDDEPNPEAVLALSVEALRGAGLSGAKTASIRDLAEKVLGGDVELNRLARLSDARIVEELILVRGIGRWTAEMFMMFQLGRLDVWPVDDLGVRKGYAVIHGLGDAPRARDLEPLGDPYRPYRSVAAWYCWRAIDTIVPEPT